MADQTTHDVVNEVLSVDGTSSIDVAASTTQSASAGTGPATKNTLDLSHDHATDTSLFTPTFVDGPLADDAIHLPNGTSALVRPSGSADLHFTSPS